MVLSDAASCLSCFISLLCVQSHTLRGFHKNYVHLWARQGQIINGSVELCVDPATPVYRTGLLRTGDGIVSIENTGGLLSEWKNLSIKQHGSICLVMLAAQQKNVVEVVKNLRSHQRTNVWSQCGARIRAKFQWLPGTQTKQDSEHVRPRNKAFIKESK